DQGIANADDGVVNPPDNRVRGGAGQRRLSKENIRLIRLAAVVAVGNIHTAGGWRRRRRRIADNDRLAELALAAQAGYQIRTDGRGAVGQYPDQRITHTDDGIVDPPGNRIVGGAGQIRLRIEVIRLTRPGAVVAIDKGDAALRRRRTDGDQLRR